MLLELHTDASVSGGGKTVQTIGDGVGGGGKLGS